MAKMAILTIDDIAPEREIVTVFGKDYELLDYEDMGLTKYSKFIKRYGAVGAEAAKASDLSDEEYEKLEAELTAMTEIVLIGIPHDVAAKITIEKKQKVLACFFTIATQKLNGQTQKIKAETEKQTTES
jgi:head-tail adaptor